MEYIRSIAQLIIALGILNVWLLRFNKATVYRGGGAKNMKQEFAAYGLPGLVYVVCGRTEGTARIVLAREFLAT